MNQTFCAPLPTPGYPPMAPTRACLVVGASAGVGLALWRLARRVLARRRSARPQQRFRTWPITAVSELEPELRAMGLRVPAAEIDGTGGGGGRARGCLSDALVSVGPAGRGGTGSFVSADGLIVTNHHVALDAVRQASAERARCSSSAATSSSIGSAAMRAACTLAC